MESRAKKIATELIGFFLIALLFVWLLNMDSRLPKYPPSSWVSDLLFSDPVEPAHEVPKKPANLSAAQSLFFDQFDKFASVMNGDNPGFWRFQEKDDTSVAGP